MNTLSIVGIAGDYRILRVHSCYPRTVVAKMRGTFMSYCFDVDSPGCHSAWEDSYEVSKKDLEYQKAIKCWPDEHKRAYEIAVVTELFNIGIQKTEETVIEFPISFPDYLKDC